MFFRFILLSFSLTSFLHTVSGDCDFNCTDKPVFTPPILVVKYGDPSSASCSVCQHACLNKTFGLEIPIRVTSLKNETPILWTIDRMTNWDMKPPLCYYSLGANQCCSNLSITVYQPPDNVSISFVNHSGLMLEGHQYILQCTVQNVAPVENLIVTFYRGQTALDQLQSNNNTEKKPVTESFTLKINASNKDDGVQYSCEAKLELGPDGPQPPPVVMSQNISATVHYKPHHPSSPEPITVFPGDRLQLTCLAMGNPSPSYAWTLPARPSSFNGSVLTINSVAFEDEGQYICSVSNIIGTINVSFNVDVKSNAYKFLVIIMAVGVVLAVIITIVLFIVFKFFLRHSMYL